MRQILYDIIISIQCDCFVIASYYIILKIYSHSEIYLIGASPSEPHSSEKKRGKFCPCVMGRHTTICVFKVDYSYPFDFDAHASSVANTRARQVAPASSPGSPPPLLFSAHAKGNKRGGGEPQLNALGGKQRLRPIEAIARLPTLISQCSLHCIFGLIRVFAPSARGIQHHFCARIESLSL